MGQPLAAHAQTMCLKNGRRESMWRILTFSISVLCMSECLAAQTRTVETSGLQYNDSSGCERLFKAGYLLLKAPEVHSGGRMMKNNRESHVSVPIGN